MEKSPRNGSDKAQKGAQNGQPSEESQEVPPEESREMSPSSASAARTPTTPKREKGGPVGQSVMHLSTLRRAPKYSFRGARDRFKTRSLRASVQVPGPGKYGGADTPPEAYSSRHRRSPGYGFGTGPREANSQLVVPGPGAYPRASSSYIGSGKAYSLTPRRWPGSPDLENDPAMPGPGAHVQEAKPDGPRYSILPRRAAKAGGVLVPGPAQYGGMEGALGRTKPRLPSWGFGTAKRQDQGQQMEDRPVNGIKGKSTSAAWMSKLPGPGSYNAPSSLGEGPKFSVGARRAAARQATSPGPGDTGGPYTTFA
ncbi:hypothetical protein AK812_SmicGene33963 [Symbiodinium microadriaticum]|uniref:Outer dense fiber protein 3 n=1 Tax=Symbiodinium microadriaticum TaxID=2951 RepID=A0A1Q9CQ68_SYMMI|nr:hypothetical protein AK812_SmicGene33963 [Symbiodinium microadriaticum]